MSTRSYPSKESATGDYTEIISLLGLRENLGYMVLEMKLFDPILSRGLLESLPSLSCYEAIITK